MAGARGDPEDPHLHSDITGNEGSRKVRELGSVGVTSRIPPKSGARGGELESLTSPYQRQQTHGKKHERSGQVLPVLPLQT